VRASVLIAGVVFLLTHPDQDQSRFSRRVWRGGGAVRVAPRL